MSLLLLLLAPKPSWFCVPVCVCVMCWTAIPTQPSPATFPVTSAVLAPAAQLDPTQLDPAQPRCACPARSSEIGRNGVGLGCCRVVELLRPGQALSPLAPGHSQNSTPWSSPVISTSNPPFSTPSAVPSSFPSSPTSVLVAHRQSSLPFLAQPSTLLDSIPHLELPMSSISDFLRVD